MKHSIIYKSKNRYSSFPLLSRMDDGNLLIGFFTAPSPDHCGLFWWNEFISEDEGETWRAATTEDDTQYDYPAVSSRERSDRLVIEKPPITILTGSPGFFMDKKGERIKRSQSLYLYTLMNKKTVDMRFFFLPDMNNVLTFPRPLIIENPRLILLPAYGLTKSGLSRAFVWRSTNGGETFKLWNMFPDGVEANEMAFILTKKGILAHIRSDKHPILMESWSDDLGKTWSYPVNVCNNIKRNQNIIGGPPHLLRLKDGNIVCSYGYRFDKMGIRAIISNDEGTSWGNPIILRDDGGYLSSLYKKKLFKKLPPPTNDVGYPVSIQLKNDKILTAYYITNEDKITHIATTIWDENSI